MLTIENIEQIKFKPIGMAGWYINGMSEILSIDVKTNQKVEQYKIELTNRAKIENVYLNRVIGDGIVNRGYHLTYHKYGMYLSKGDIQNMDKFVYWIDRLVHN
jgi:hypothetical protein